jgi:hypothetical protein
MHIKVVILGPFLVVFEQKFTPSNNWRFFVKKPI